MLLHETTTRLGFFGTVKNFIGNLPFVSNIIGTDVRAHNAPASMPAEDTILGSSAAERPVIGISGECADSRSVQAMMTTIRQQGAIPVLLSYHKERLHGIDTTPGDDGFPSPQAQAQVEAVVRQDLQGLSGLVIMGNGKDIDPRTYAKNNERRPDGTLKTDVETNHARAAYERAGCEIALAGKMPLFGVCGGHQRINVGGPAATRGDLIQDVANHMQGNTENGMIGFTPVEPIILRENSRLASIAGGARSLYAPAPGVSVEENSFHHQAIGKIRQGFIASAHAPDGTIEAIEPDPAGPYADQFVLGTQWHPEFAASQLSVNIASHFTNAAAEYQQTHRIASLDEHSAMMESAFSSIPQIEKLREQNREADKTNPQPVESWVERLGLDNPAGIQKPARNYATR